MDSQVPTISPIGTDHGGWAGHPRGLSTLFFTEMWERFSYYGMRAFLILYLVAPVSTGGMGFSAPEAASIYGTYTGSAWGAAILGGFVADRLIGQYYAVLLGGILIALGHFTLAFNALAAFYGGLALIAAGTGLLKPNVSTIVGSLYEQGDRRRDPGFSIFYMGINSGGLIGQIVAGYIAQKINWHAGFATAGIGMVFGLAQYWLGRERLQQGLDRLAKDKASRRQATTSAAGAGLTRDEWTRILAIFIFFVFASLFWGAYEQAGSTLNLFADQHTRLSVLGWEFPSSWLQGVQSACVILFAPVMAWLWTRLGRFEPSSPAKFALGLLFVGPGVRAAHAGRHDRRDGPQGQPALAHRRLRVMEIGELCLSPVGLSVVTKLSPARLVGVMMGVFFLSNALGNKIAGFAAGFVGSMPLPSLFGTVAAVTLGAALVLAVMVPGIRKLMAGVQ